jgi:hypothetical protein
MTTQTAPCFNKSDEIAHNIAKRTGSVSAANNPWYFHSTKILFEA